MAAISWYILCCRETRRISLDYNKWSQQAPLGGETITEVRVWRKQMFKISVFLSGIKRVVFGLSAKRHLVRKRCNRDRLISFNFLELEKLFIFSFSSTWFISTGFLLFPRFCKNVIRWNRDSADCYYPIAAAFKAD